MTVFMPAFRSLASLLLCLLAPLSFGVAHAGNAAEIDASVGEALEVFRKSVKGADEYLAAAKGVLVIPEVKKVGLVVGGQWGEGALQIDGKQVAYYKMKSASVGMQAGYQKASYVFVFFTQGALNDFRKAKGWDAGAEGGITVVDESVGFSADTLKSKASVAAFIYGKEGLMGGFSLKGQKLTKFQPAK